MHKVQFSNIAARELENIHNIDKKLYFRMITAIESLRSDPRRGKKLRGKLKDDYSLRIGEYRILYTIQKNILTVYIVDLGHRREIYR